MARRKQTETPAEETPIAAMATPEPEITEEVTEPVQQAEPDKPREPLPAPNNPRRDRLKDILANRRAEFDQENREARDQIAEPAESKTVPDHDDEISKLEEKIAQGAGDEDDAAALAELKAAREAAAQDEPEADPEPKTEPKVEAKTEGPVYVRAVVNGTAYDVPKDEIDEAGGVAAWQKNKAADLYLSEARELLKEAKAAKTAPAVEPEPVKPAPDAREEARKKLVKAMMFSDENAAAEALAEYEKAASPAPGIDPRIAAAELLEERESKRQFQEFATANRDIVGNPIRERVVTALVRDEMVADLKQLGLTDQQAAEIPDTGIAQYHAKFRALGKARPIEAVYGDAAKRYRSEFGQPAATPQVQGNPAQTIRAPQSLASKLEGKRAAASLTPAGASARAPLPTVKRPRTDEEKIAAMRSQRPASRVGVH